MAVWKLAGSFSIQMNESSMCTRVLEHPNAISEPECAFPLSSFTYLLYREIHGFISKLYALP